MSKLDFKTAVEFVEYLDREYHLGVRLKIVLLHLNIISLDQFLELDDAFLMRQPNFGRYSLREFQEVKKRIFDEYPSKKNAESLSDTLVESLRNANRFELEEILIQNLLDILQDTVKKDKRGLDIMICRLLHAENCTLQDLGTSYGISRERVRQIEERLFRKFCMSLKSVRSSTHRTVKQILRKFESQSPEMFVDDLYELLSSYFSERYCDQLVVSLSGKKPRKKEEVSDNNEVEESPKSVFLHLIDALASKSMFFHEGMTVLQMEDVMGFSSQRQVSSAGIGRNGTFFSKKLNRHVCYESQMEHNVYKALDKSHFIKWYCEQPFKIPYQFEGKDYFYYPDVFALDAAGIGYILEVKPLTQMVCYDVLVKMFYGLKFARQKGFSFTIIDNRGHSLKDLWEGIEVHGDFEDELLKLLSLRKHLGWVDVRPLIHRYGITHQQFLKTVLKRDLKFMRNPWTLKYLEAHKSYKPFLKEIVFKGMERMEAE